MAATVLLNAVSIAAGQRSSSAAAVMTLTPPCAGLQINLSETRTAAGPPSGCTLLVEKSIDGTIFSDPVGVINCQTNGSEIALSSSATGFVDAKNCTKVRFTVLNRDSLNAATVTLSAVQV